GKWLAFTAQYDGNTEVYVMPAEGGAPRRLTFTATLGRDDVADRMGPNNIVMTWKNTANEIVFRSRMRSFNSFIGQLYTVDLKGDLPQQVPVPRGGFCSFSPDDQKMAYNRVFREFRTWKRYRGGMADDVWVFDLNTRTVENITNNPAQDIIPMWAGDKIYFLSDRSEEDNLRMNLFVYDLNSKETTQLTHFKDFDIKFPSLGKDAIVFEYAGYIYRFDLATRQYEKVNIQILEDFTTGRGGLVEVSKNVTNYEIAPDGKRALFGARGEVFTVPAKEGPTRNLTQTSGVHERNSKWSPDGKWIAFISDKTGINELYIIRQDGKGGPIQITDGADTYYYQLYWSPDSRKLLWADKKQRLRFVDINTKQITEVDQATAWEIRQYAWSPDSKWIAYMRPEEKSMNKIYLYSLEQQQKYPVTEGWYDAGNPAFSADGKYLLFVSSRDFNPIYSWTEWNHAYRDMERVYLVPLSKKIPSPFEPKSDEVEIQSTKTGKSTSEKKESPEKGKKETTVVVDIDGIADRVIGLPISAGSYGSVAMVDNVVYYIRNSSTDKKPVLLMYDLKNKKEKELGQINGYEISANGKKMLVSQNRNYYIIDLPKSELHLKDPLDLSNMEMTLDRHAEWKQIFHECWVQMRDFFYAPNMHGVNWEQIREKYEPLVDYVNHRNDLTYIIGEMIGELNVGHAYVGGGERPEVKRIPMGLLGAELERDAQSGYYRITKILKGENWNKRTRSPLTEVGVDVKEGDYILAVNGHPTDDMKNIYESLINTVDKQVVLTVNSKPQKTGSRNVTVVPIVNEGPLYYYNWVQGNIEKVNKATNGKVGYIHIPDMGVNGLNEFVKHFYPQLRKKALIIDVRGNGGGNVSPMIIERLRREIAMITIARNTAPDVNPGAMLWGPKVLIVDEFAASDGDIFTYRFKKHKLGKVIGKRSWGGVVGIRGSLPLLDGGYLYRPEFSRYDVEGKKWIIEGV
ncbi:MAG: protease, partial [Calditrichaeota bacterium]